MRSKAGARKTTLPQKFLASRKELASRRELASLKSLTGIRLGTGFAELVSRSEPGRERQNPDHLSVAGDAWRVLVNTLSGLAGDRLPGCDMRPRYLDQIVEAVQ